MTRICGGSIARFCYASLFVAISLLTSSCGTESQAPPTVLRIGELGPLAPGSRDIELRGVVTYFDARAGVLYLQDETGARAFEIGELAAPVVSGQSIALTGTLESAKTLVRLSHPRVTVLGQSTPGIEVLARHVEIPALLAGAAESHWVNVHGLVRSAVQDGPSLALEIEEGGATARALIVTFSDPTYPPLVGARLRLNGVSVARAHPWAGRRAADLVVLNMDAVRIEQDSPLLEATSEGHDPSLPRLTTANQIRRLSREDAA